FPPRRSSDLTDGNIMDAKTIMLLQHLRLKGIL
ncbi:MAG TPA: GDP-mannose pyrophosphatase NudK, partial [Pantoea sp.]|nr:GDP-mannose pyrophosphatase NudK [Pantoea sp.]